MGISLMDMCYGSENEELKNLSVYHPVGNFYWTENEKRKSLKTNTFSFAMSAWAEFMQVDM